MKTTSCVMQKYLISQSSIPTYTTSFQNPANDKIQAIVKRRSKVEWCTIYPRLTWSWRPWKLSLCLSSSCLHPNECLTTEVACRNSQIKINSTSDAQSTYAESNTNTNILILSLQQSLPPSPWHELQLNVLWGYSCNLKALKQPHPMTIASW